MSARKLRATGGCLCGAVRYRIHGPLRGVVNCHCRQCRRTHGHVAAYTAVDPRHLVLTAAAELRWFVSSTRAQRGFCRVCGASLFWKPAHGRHLSIAAGTLDEPTGLVTIAHIYTEDAGDYYELGDGLPAYPGTME